MVTLKVVAQKTDMSLLAAGWKEGETKNVYGHQILRVSGVNTYGYTNISFSSSQDLIEMVKSEGEEQMRLKEEIQKDVDMYSSISGTITLYIGRITLSAANPENLTMIVQDINGNELERKSFKSDIPETPGSDKYWWNTATMILMNKKIKPPFNVFVIDRIDSTNPKSHFKVLD